MTQFIGKEAVNQITPHQVISRYIEVNGLRVLEIGGNSNCLAATPFVNSGASQVTVSGLIDVNPENTSKFQNIQLINMDALALSDYYDKESFDVVYGVSVLEHIHQLEKLFKEIFKILSKGGVAYLQGAPIWTGPWGHHVWVDNWRDKTIKSYHFQPYPGADSYNPIQDWGHLLFNRHELSDILIDDGIPERDVDVIMFKVFDSESINRLSMSAICQSLFQSGLVIRELEVDRAMIDADTLKRLRQLHGCTEDFQINGVRVVLQKM